MLIDTSGLLALALAKQPQHPEARRLFAAAHFKLTHNYVIAEFIPLAHSRGLPRRQALEFVDKLYTDSDVEIAFVDEELHRTALRFLQARLDKEWSLCDAVSFILMERFKVWDALTTDHHFEQAGFVRLLES